MSDEAREALRRATAGLEPDLGRLLDAVPGMLAEARHRQLAEVRQDAVAALVPLARRVLPRLAAVTLALVILCVGISLYAAAEDRPPTLDSVILSTSTESIDVHPLLETILGGSNGHG